ncbi:response regulator transcription factor [Paraburkholderia saeva]|jgi:DNA-binding NarL/FixJ family response regulator|uniref:DNA-binding response regulator n=1 Tax=Paraburkholderia saeva TaxID=2777537 RepID=A0A9N8RZS9_9BURK|nr:response regulator transcription factor [Paraburkholderia saeva]CAG4890068.1 hypothetical protein R70241_00905 [Paraburkholderia saeva]CAG4897788.1 hypothetical protein R52603_02357 [Paraburkholderia saeva]CAG4912478.1 hypothetical protein LMG31841_04173 [Paraburkholderia saeva]
MIADPIESRLRRLLIVGHDSLTQIRLRAIFASLGYAHRDALFFADSIAETAGLPIDDTFVLALIAGELPDGATLDLIRSLQDRQRGLPVVVIAEQRNELDILAMLHAGAAGYVLKSRDDVELALYIRSALCGGTPIDPFVARRLLDVLNRAGRMLVPPVSSEPAVPPKSSLSARETEILDFVGRGLSNREISCLLSLSTLTVESHLKNIFRKLAVKRRTQAILEARARGLLP